MEAFAIGWLWADASTFSRLSAEELCLAAPPSMEVLQFLSNRRGDRTPARQHCADKKTLQFHLFSNIKNCAVFLFAIEFGFSDCMIQACVCD
ncbi:hypothetical protein evm_013109 [Chilo suppressalis]|nr:hypothetical protein evm_013109 [Chilo suppressalis]